MFCFICCCCGCSSGHEHDGRCCYFDAAAVAFLLLWLMVGFWPWVNNKIPFFLLSHCCFVAVLFCCHGLVATLWLFARGMVVAAAAAAAVNVTKQKQKLVNFTIATS